SRGESRRATGQSIFPGTGRSFGLYFRAQRPAVQGSSRRRGGDMSFTEKFKLRSATKQRRPATAVPAAESVIDPRHEDDETLVSRVQRGDSAAFDILIERYKE